MPSAQLTAIVDALGGRKEGSSYRCLCPVHNGHALAVTEKAGKILLYCHAGCSQEDVLEILRERGLWSDAQPPSTDGTEPTHGEVLEDQYEYRTADGEVQAIKGRFRTFGGKTFKWRSPKEREWNGLKGRKESSLPLYNTHLLSQHDGLVIVVEGEKACKACTALGLLALCTPGGAGAKEFGESLDILAGRDVVLWPDNDDAGRALMRRIAAVLGGKPASVRYVSADVPPKGDAFDYFGQGGTVETLMEIIDTVRTGPWVEEVPDGYLVSLPDAGGRVCFQFLEMEHGRRSLEAELSVWQEIPGVTREPFEARLNLPSLSGRNTFRQQLDEMYGKVEWTAKLNRACQLARDAYRQRDESVVLIEAPAVSEDYLIRGFMSGDGASMLFGQGGAGKTLLAELMAVCIALGVPFLGREVKQRAVLYIDYESSAWRLRQRLERLLAGIGMRDSVPALFYWPGRGVPLHDMVPALERKIARDDIGAIFVDSVVLAAGADPERSETAARYFNSLARLGPPSQSVAHVTKNDDDKYPFGSIFYHNSARLTWNLKLIHDDGDVAHLGLHNRKANDDRPEPSFGLRVIFGPDGGPITFTREDLATVPGLNKDLPLKTRILGQLVKGAERITAKELAEELEEKEDSVARTLRRMENVVSIDRTTVPHRYGALEAAR